MHRCPECHSAVDLGGISLPPSGRLVSCGICSAIWRAFPLAEPLTEALLPVPSVPAAPHSADQVPVSAAPVRSPRQLTAWLVRLRRAGVGLAATLAIGGCLLAVRDYLAVWVPTSRGGFAALGVPARPSDVAVELVAIAPLEDGSAFRVTYEVVNETVLSRPLPKVCATGRNSEAERLFLRCFAGDGQGIPSRGSRRFSFVAADLAAPLAELDLDLSFK